MTWWVYIPRRNGDHHRWASVTASRASVQNAPVYHHCFEPDSDRILIGKWRAGRRPLDGSHVPALISDFSTSPVSAANDSFVNTQPVHSGLNVLIPCRYYSTATSTFSTTTIKGVLCNFPLSAKQTKKKDFSLGSFLELGRCAGANYREKTSLTDWCTVFGIPVGSSLLETAPGDFGPQPRTSGVTTCQSALAFESFNVHGFLSRKACPHAQKNK